MIVVDASVAVKWFIAELASNAADRLLAENIGNLAGPDQLAVEVCATLVREANRDKSNRSASEHSLTRWRALLDTADIQLYRHTGDQLAQAARFAIDLGHPLKDCIYLALAVERGCPLITADVRFADKARAVWPEIRLIETRSRSAV